MAMTTGYPGTMPERMLPSGPGPRLAHALRQAWRTNPALTITGLLMTGTLLAAGAGLLLDPRAILNEPAWLKPAKFAISIAIYSFTLVWLMSFLQVRRWVVMTLSLIIAGTLIVEEIVIGYQAFRGLRSHFNVATPFDAALWATMGTAIVILWVASAIVAVLILRQRFTNVVLARALQGGLVVALVGMAVAFMMGQPTPDQLAVMQADQMTPYIGAHTVSAPDGGPGLPIVGWSTVGGDLRVAHFVGLHALQALPVLAWLLLRLPRPWLRPTDRARLIVVASGGALGVVLLLTWQALRGQSVIAPDALTLTAWAGLAAVMVGGAAVVVLSARRRAGVAG